MSISSVPMLFILVVLLALVIGPGSSSDGASPESVQAKLAAALATTDGILGGLLNEWDVKNYPNFLRSVGMTHISWEVMKLKFKHKILSNMLGKGSKDTENFVIAWMGSSVTAGHDTIFNETFTVLTGNIMSPAFEHTGITLESRNAAMGNNPCVPYDLCPKTFAGPDADLVHWEQSYNCFAHDIEKTGPIFEQFVRQSIHMRKKPIVVFAESSTPNWNAKECDKPENKGKVGVNQDDVKRYEKALKHEVMSIATEDNIDLVNKGEWSGQAKMIHSYQTQAGIQIWSHHHYEAYKCRGPYTADWQCCAASWHPSKKGHKVRAAHHSYFWLSVWHDALQEVLNIGTDAGSLAKQLAEIDRHIDQEGKHTPQAAMYDSIYSDDMQCLNTFLPRWDPQADLRKWVLPFEAPARAKEEKQEESSGGNRVLEELPDASYQAHPEEPISGSFGGGWQINIFEELTNGGIVKMAKGRGYHDYKYMLHGNKDSAPLNIRIHIEKGQGTVLLCEPPGNWGKLPAGFQTLWEADTKVFFTKDVDTDGAAEGNPLFVFDESKAHLLPYTKRGKPSDSQVVCVDFDTFKPPPGKHVLTIRPTAEHRVMVSTLLLPA